MATTSETFVQDRRTWNDHIKKYELDVYYEYDCVAIDCKPDDTPELFVFAHDVGTQRQMSTSSDNLAYVAHMHEQC